MNDNELQQWVETGKQWLNGEIIIKEFNGFKFNPKQVELINCKERQALICGGYRCLDGDTLIYNAKTGEEVAIKDIREDFEVLTLENNTIKKAMAVKPSLVGRDKLLRVVHEGGEFVAHPKHTVLTPSGFVTVDSLRPADHLIQSDEDRRESIEESFLSRFFLNVLRYTRIIPNSLSYCFAYLRRCGEQLLLGLNNVLSAVPLPNGVRERIYRLVRQLHKGGRAYKLARNRLYQLFVRLSKTRVGVGLRAFFGGGSPLMLFFVHILHYNRQALQFVLMSFDHLTARGFSLLYVNSPYLNPTTKILSIQETEERDYYDFHVLGNHNYIAGGAVHHNSGKTVAMIAKMWLLAMFFPGNRILLGRKTLSDIETATMPAIEDVFPAGSYVYRPGKHMIEFPNGSQILLYGLDTSVSGDDTKKAAQKIKGLDLGAVFIDQLEEVSELMYKQLVGRMSRDVPFHQTCSTTNPANFWAYDHFKVAPSKSEELKKSRRLIETGMQDNEDNLPDGFIESQRENGELYWRRFVLGEWSPDTIVDGTVYDPEHLERMRHQVQDPIRESGGIKIFEEPDKQIYQIGVDPSVGSSDPGHIKVISIDTGHEVACFSGYVPTQQLVNKAITLANMYNVLKDPLIIPEVTGIGESFVEELRKRYDKIYIREVYNDRERRKTKKLGFSTNYATKMQLIEHFRKQLAKKFPKIRDKSTFEEFQVFTYRDEAASKGASAPDGYHDDAVMATLLAFWGVEGEGESTTEDSKQSLIRTELKKIDKIRRRISRKKNMAR